MVADGLYGQPADAPERERDQRHDAERAPSPWIERFLRQHRRHKAGDVNVLPVGVGARLIEPQQRMLVSGFGEFAFAFELLV